MNKRKYLKIVCWIVLLTVGIWHFGLKSEPAQAQYESGGSPDVGRDNPFAKLPQVKAIPQNILRSSTLPQQTSDLFVETVTLRYLDAQSLSDAIEGLSSEYGSISIDKRTNSLIICDTKEFLERILAQIQRAEETMTSQNVAIADQNAPELFVETVTLKFLDAKNLQTAIGGMSSTVGSISADTKTNSLIICDTKQNLQRILAEIREADKTPEQIMVEVVILDVQLNDDTEIGINWDILSDKNYDVGYRQNFTTSRMGSTAESAGTIGNATAFVTTGLGGDFSVISGTIRNVVHLVQQKRDVEILASPRVMMVSGQSATIDAIEEIPYEEITDTSQGGAGALTSTKFKDVGVKLQVSATLADGNDILLIVDAEQNVTSGQSNSDVPIVDTRKAHTSLLLRDGQVVVLGGLRRQEKTKEVDQIPIIGDLPIIGELFKSTHIVVRNSELIVFLSPHIYRQEPIDDDEMAKFREIREKPLLSLPEDDNSKENNDRLDKRIKEQGRDDEKHQKEITERKRSEDELKEYINQFKQRVKEQTVNNDQLQQENTERMRAEDELEKYLNRLKESTRQQTAANEKLRQEVAERKHIEDELKRVLRHFEDSARQQTAANEKLQEEIAERKRSEDELKEYINRFRQRVKEQTVDSEQLQKKVAERIHAEDELKKHLDDRLTGYTKQRPQANVQLQRVVTTARRPDIDDAKNMLLKRIKMLQNKKGKGVTEELLSTLDLLDKIIGREIRECRHASGKILSSGSL